MTCQQLSSVLVVDDDPLLCEIAESYFRKAGAANVAVAHNGREALKIVEQRSDPIDLILLDLKMPVMDGIQFLRHMHEREHQGAIGIVSGEGAAILSLAMQLAEKHGLNVVGSLSKPLDATRLEELISEPKMSQNTVCNSQWATLTARELEFALGQQQIIAHYQPQIDVATGALSGVEALARWMHPERGLIPPGLFIPLAEDNALMRLLTDQMIKTVIGEIGTLNDVSRDMTVSINIGATVLNDTVFPDTVASIVDGCGQDRSRFILELTESKLVQDSTDSLEVLARLDLAGFELSLDDFGTQFSNIEQLTKFPFKELKIDRGFVQSAATDARSKATVESCVSLGRQLDMRIVAEGAETGEDWNYLTGLGVDIIQGFWIAKPMPIDTLVSWAGAYRTGNVQGEKTALS